MIRDLFKKFLTKDGQIGFENKPVREAWLEKKLKEIPAGKKILDAGAGELQYKKFCEHLEYVSQDFAQYDGKGNNEGGQMGSWDNSKLDIISDIIDIPVEHNSFDALMCIEVFEHIPEPVKAVKEFSRILKPGGTLILTAPYCSTNHFAPYYYANGYSRYWYEKVLPENGFSIKEIDFNGNFFAYLAQEIRHIPFMEEKYTAHDNKLMTEGFFYLVLKTFMLNFLFKLSNRNRNSEEILSFGLHVLAVKK